MSTRKKTRKFLKIRACRLCLDFEREDNILIDGNEGWFELLEYCIGLKVFDCAPDLTDPTCASHSPCGIKQEKIKVQDKPQMICSICAKSLWNFVEFKKQCLKSHSIWKSVTSDDMIYQIKKNWVMSEIKTNNISLFEKLLNGGCMHKEELSTSYMEKNEKETDSKNIKDDTFSEIISNNNMVINDNLNDSVSDIETKEETKEISDCTFNNKDIIAENTLKLSIKKKTNNEFACKYCSKIFGKRKEVNKHIKTCSKLKDEKQKMEIQQTFLCGLCRFTSCSVEDVNKHFIAHMQRNDLECKMCNFVGIDFAQMLAHRMCHNSTTFTVKVFCPHCKKSPKSQYSMEFHYRSAHLNKNGGFCSTCNMEFTEYVKFRYHMLTHSDAKYICDICNMNFLFRKNIIRHLKNHLDPKKFVCHECGKSFQRSNYLAENCADEEYDISQTYILYKEGVQNTHMNTVHVKDDPIKCTHCNKYFKSAFTLNHHMKMYLDKKSSLKCDICGKCFSKPYELKSHQFWHTGERPHCCEICGSRYKAKGQLKVHMQKHSGLRPYKCESCSKCFPSPRELRRHSRVHTGVRPYKCRHCDRNFNVKKQVLKHCAVVHKLVDVGDKDCFYHCNKLLI